MTIDERQKAVFEEAVLREGPDRAALVEAACAGDAELQRRVTEMLAEAERTILVDRSVGGRVAELLASGDDARVMIGTTLGPYRIDGPLGAGGMGEVYLATDTGPLARQVALKILPHDFSLDPDRVARFRREARLLASLNHPHLAHVYGFHEFALPDGPLVHALAMEHVPGETLAKRLAAGPMPIDEALTVAREIAEGLEAAHLQGIVHRDLKPANVKITPDGQVKILDFGLAKATTASGTPGSSMAQSPTITSPALVTGAGMLLGTAAYMSPEQAKGREADKRSDVWAFGCVLYEMLSGRRVFDGDDVVDVLSAVVRLEPYWTALPQDVPAPVVTLLQSCLTKDRRTRLGDIAGAIFVLDHAAALSSRASTQSGGAESPRLRRVITAAAVAAAASALLTFIATRWAVQPAEALATHVDIALPADAPLTGQGVALSPDGRVLVVPAGNRLLLRRLDRAEFTPLPGTDGATLPFFSPDGGWIGFFANGSMRKVRIDGSTPITVAQIGLPLLTPAWGPDDTIVFSNIGTGLFRVSAAGGTPVPLTKLRRDTDDVGHVNPQWLPDGRLLFSIRSTRAVTAVAILDVGTGAWDVLPETLGLRGTTYYAKSGHLAFVSGATLMAVPYRLGDQRPSGSAVPIANDVDLAFAVTGNGTLAFLPSGAAQSNNRITGRLALVDRTGTPLDFPWPDAVTNTGGISGNGLTFNADGTRIAAGLDGAALGRGAVDDSLWIYDLQQRKRVRITTNEAAAAQPRWSADDRELLFSSTRNPVGLYAQAPKAGAMPRLIQKRDGPPQVPYAWRADGTIVFGVRDPQTGLDIWLTRPDGTSSPLVNSAAQERAARLSPDGQWLAYESDASGQPEIYVRRLDEAGEPDVVSDGGGTDPRWVGTKELIYRRGREVVALPITLNSARSMVGSSHVLFQIDDYATTYDVSPNGNRFIMLRRDSPAPSMGRVHLVLNWFDELRRLSPVN